VLNSLLCLFLFVLSVTITARFTGSAFPSNDMRFFDRKLAQLQEADPPYDVIFTGSSRVYRHIRPALFDSVAAAHGISTHSYNFGYTGTTPLETPHQLRQILEHDRGGHVKWVFVSLEGLETQLEKMNLRSDRMARYHDVHTFARHARLLFANENLTMRERLESLADRVPPLFIHYTGYGRGGTWFRERVDGRSYGIAETWYRHEDGFLSLDSAVVYAEGVARDRLERRRDKLARLLDQNGPPATPDRDLAYQQPVLEDLVADISAVVRAHGAEAVFFARTMDADAAHDLESARDDGFITHFISLDDADRYPELHDMRYQFDEGHFGAEGAAYFTRYLAEGFLPIAKAGGAAP
ncbi:MAG: hypothetical protein HKN20_15385, partial [Gemmatimonadetes bacterium]|nr:hypothetical protein [Gemmatimonadota bacterium]